MPEIKKRFVFSGLENSLPLYIESIGYNPKEEDFARPEGYPYYHWLQTIEGEGTVKFNEQELMLSKGKGVLIMPFTPHSYYANTEKWSTLYLTFSGASVESILGSLELMHSAFYTETAKEPILSQALSKMMDNIEDTAEFSRLDSTKYLFDFLIALKKMEKTNTKNSLSEASEKVFPLVQWMEEHYDQDIGLQDMIEKAGVSSQYLTKLFRQALKMSPYNFLIQLRIREAKKKLVTNHTLSMKEIALQVGFQDASHFTATFKKIEGITPKKYKELFNQT